MTDKEIIALVDSKLPQELTLEEIDLVRQRMRASPTVRRALAAQLELDQYLSGLIGKVDLSPDAVFAGAGRSGRFGKGSIFSWLGWAVCLLMMGFVVSMLVWAFVVRPNNGDAPANVAQNDGKSNANEAGPGGKSTADKGDSAAKKLDEAKPATGKPGDGKKPTNQLAASGPQLPADPASIAGMVKRGPGRFEITATLAPRTERLTIDRDNFGRGIGVLTGGDHGWAEFDFIAPTAGNYRVELRYATTEPRPLKLSLNGVVIKERGAVEVTGNVNPEGQRWFSEGIFAFRQGKNTLRLEAQGAFPNLSRVAFAQTAAEITAAFAPPATPWLTKDNLGAEPRPMDDIAFEAFDAVGAAPSLDDARRWLTPFDNGHLEQRDYFGARVPSLDGRLRLNAPLKEDSVLRLSLCEAQWLSINFWLGKTGLTLRIHDNKGALVAYVTSGPDKNRPIRVLAATDDDRNWRTNQPLWPLRMDIRFHKGLMVISRGDVELLRAPFEGVPEEVIFEGHALIRGLALVRTTSELPPEPAPRPIVADFARPADLKWESQLPQGMSIAKLDDGSVQLKSQPAPQPGWMALALPGGGLGLKELIVELDDVSPGTNVGLGNLQSDPKPKATVGFFRDNNSGGLSFRWNTYGDASLDFGADFNGPTGAANAARHFWLKFIGGCGLKCYSSIDGVHWARSLQTQENRPPFR